jgi:hypothetical protein
MVKYYLCLREIDLCSLYEELEDTKRGNQNPYIEEEQTTQWPKEKVQKGKQRSRKQIYKTTYIIFDHFARCIRFNYIYMILLDV